MKSKSTILATAALLAGAWLLAAVADGRQPVEAADDLITSTPMKDLRGNTRTLAEWSGRVRLVNFWATWCAPCRAEMPVFQNAYERYRHRNFVVVGVALDEADAVARFSRQLGITYPLLIVDTRSGMDLMSQYGNQMGVVPFSVLLSENGEVIATHLGAFDEAGLNELLKGHLDDTPGMQLTRATPPPCKTARPAT